MIVNLAGVATIVGNLHALTTVMIMVCALQRSRIYSLGRLLIPSTPLLSLCAGSCSPTTATCTCDEGYTGVSCADRVCPGSGPYGCSGHGLCVKGVCSCRTNYSGAACDQKACPGDAATVIGPNASRDP